MFGLRCLYKQCLCIDIPGYCRRIKALSLMFKSAANAPCHLTCEGLWEWFRGREARLHISHVSGEVSKWDVGELIPRNYSAITAQLAANELINAVTPHAERRRRGCVVSGVHSGVRAHK